MNHFILSLISQLTLFQNITSKNPRAGHLFATLTSIMLITAAVCFLISEITRNYSQVDKIWSIMPIVYSLITLSYCPDSPRIWIMTLLVTFWGVRLSYNFYRKGGYNIIPWKGEEDYRWSVLRQNPVLKGIRFTLFNLLFISLYQLFLILLFCTPLVLALEYNNVSLNFIDILAALLMISCILLETIADNQLFEFHLQKKQKIIADGKYNRSLQNGFMSDGLWKYVRHPNFIGEQFTWVSFYLFGVAASGQWINWTLTGPVLLILLFMGSSDFTEGISLKKYPLYAEYKETVPRYFPLNKDIIKKQSPSK
ncbi:MAG: DUF1295 domain-containing protein [Paludibacter sp.]